MKKTVNILLAIAVAVPLLLLFWPFASWDGAMSLILRVIAVLAAQALFCRVWKRGVLRIVPAVLTGTASAWARTFIVLLPIGAMQPWAD